MHRHLVAFAAFLSLTAAVPAMAQEITPEQTRVVMQIANGGGGGGGRLSTYEEFLSLLTKPIRTYDADKDGLDMADLDMMGNVRSAMMRTQLLMQFLPYDLDNDQTVTKKEMEVVLRSGQQNGGGGFGGMGSAEVFASRDSDADGSLSWKEMTTDPRMNSQQEAMMQARMQNNGRGEPNKMLLQLDQNGDGKFTIAEARQVADAFYAKYDVDKDGLLDQREMGGAMQAMQQ